MKKVLKTLGIIFIVFIIAVIGAGFYMTRGLEKGKDIVVNEVKTTRLIDGDYNGEYKSGRWSNEVKVTIKEGKISALEVIKDVTFPKPEWTKQLFDKVIEKQSTEVDVISGATVTSKAYLKSIENALNDKTEN